MQPSGVRVACDGHVGVTEHSLIAKTENAPEQVELAMIEEPGAGQEHAEQPEVLLKIRLAEW